MKKFSIVVAATSEMGIGYKGKLPWKLPNEMKNFVALTTNTNDPNKQNAVFMGSNTWKSIPEQHRPLKNRINIVLTRNKNFVSEYKVPSNVHIVSSIREALELANSKNVENVFCIGGAKVYREAMKSPYCEKIYITKILNNFECDTFMPTINPKWFKLDEKYGQELYEENGVKYKYCLYTRIPKKHEEYQYLDLVREIIEYGTEKDDRTGTGTYSIFGAQMRFDLRESFPLLTTKQVFFKGVVLELLWFISGCTSSKVLSSQGCKIWDANGSKEFLNSIGLTNREEGDLGPVYGFQWRHWGAQYVDMHTDYKGKGIDQLKNCIEKIKKNPNDRRIVMSAWNPSELSKMALPPCHMFCQFYVANGELSCQMYQRSCDMGLGVPFNIASYSLLTCMIAQVCGLKPGDFVHTLGDAHVYKNHVEALRVQLQREPRPFPKLVLNPEVKNIDDFKFSDIKIVDYHPHKVIKMDMAV